MRANFEKSDTHLTCLVDALRVLCNLKVLVISMFKTFSTNSGCSKQVNMVKKYKYASESSLESPSLVVLLLFHPFIKSQL